jgi:hypothetical protein
MMLVALQKGSKCIFQGRWLTRPGLVPTIYGTRYTPASKI